MINRHLQLREDIVKDEVDYYLDSFYRTCEAIKKRPLDNLGSEFRKSLKILAFLAIDSRDKKEIFYLLKIAQNIGLMNFKFGTKIGESFNCSLEEESFTLVGQETSIYMDTDTWLRALYLSLILRDMDAVDFLCQVPESVHIQANIKADAFDIAFVRVMKGLFNPDVNIGKLLVEAMDISKSELIPSARLEYIDYIMVPQLLLYYRFISCTRSEFNEQFRDAVLDHKEYWSEKNREYDPKGWISLPLITIAALAFDDKKYELPFETEYIPNWLVREEFS